MTSHAAEGSIPRQRWPLIPALGVGQTSAWDGFASTVYRPLSVLFVEPLGWRGAVILPAVGLAILALCLPLIGLAVFLYGAGNGLFSIAREALPLAFRSGSLRPSQGRLARRALIAQAVAPDHGVCCSRPLPGPIRRWSCLPCWPWRTSPLSSSCGAVSKDEAAAPTPRGNHDPA